MTDINARDVSLEDKPVAAAKRSRSFSRTITGLICAACVLFLVGATSMAEAPFDWSDFAKATGVLVFVVSMTLVAFGVIREDLRA